MEATLPSRVQLAVVDGRPVLTRPAGSSLLPKATTTDLQAQDPPAQYPGENIKFVNSKDLPIFRPISPLVTESATLIGEAGVVLRSTKVLYF